MKAAIALTLIVFYPCLGFTGVIFGSINSEEGLDHPKEVEIIVSCQGFYRNLVLEIPGTYSIDLPSKGPCEFTVLYDEKSELFPFKSNKKPSRFDFIFVEEEGKYTLKRR